MKILVIDDSKTMLRINKMMAEQAGASEVLTALNGEEGIKILDKDIDIILLDINMPICSGYCFLEKTINFRKENNIKVIMCTTEAGRNEVIKALKLGANSYITKPIDKAALIQKIKDISTTD